MTKKISSSEVDTIIVACEAGMGSSLMSVNALKKKLKAAGLSSIKVIHEPVRAIPENAKLVVVHKGLAKAAQLKAPNAVIVAFNQFLNDPVFDYLVKTFSSGGEIEGADL